jgi:hypothetical protein
MMFWGRGWGLRRLPLCSFLGSGGCTSRWDTSLVLHQETRTLCSNWTGGVKGYPVYVVCNIWGLQCARFAAARAFRGTSGREHQRASAAH